MKLINFIKDVYNRKKLIRLRSPWLIRDYDLRREIALFWDTPAFMPENSNKEQYETLVAVNNFGGYSGATVVTDFLAEFDETTVIGCNPLTKHDKTQVPEFYYWAQEGSVVSLEAAIFSPKFYFTRLGALEFSTFVIRQMYSGVCVFDDYWYQRSKKFLFDLVDCHWRWSAGMWSFDRKANLLKQRAKTKSYDIDELPQRIQIEDPLQSQVVEAIWKDVSVKEYREHARKYYEDWLKHLPSKKFMVLCQALNIGRFDAELFEDYFGDIKIIYVWRDPRDQYERLKGPNSIPKNPLVFSKRFKKIADTVLTAKHKNLLVVRLEEFCTDYDRVSKEIIDFLGLDPAKHTKKFEFFDPKISGKKIGIHKTYHDQEVIKTIENELKEYCWYN